MYHQCRILHTFMGQFKTTLNANTFIAFGVCFHLRKQLDMYRCCYSVIVDRCMEHQTSESFCVFSFSGRSVYGASDVSDLDQSHLCSHECYFRIRFVRSVIGWVMFYLQHVQNKTNKHMLYGTSCTKQDKQTHALW